MISSHVKITCYFHMWKYHRCYGYIINHAFRRIKLFQWMVWYFIGVYIINRTLHGRLEIRNFSSRVENISLVRCTHSWNIFQHSKRNFVSLHGHVISSINPWFKFYFLLFLGMVMYDNNMIMSLKQKKIKFKPRIKLNHNMYIVIYQDISSQTSF